jgi:hypothetical protein
VFPRRDRDKRAVSKTHEEGGLQVSKKKRKTKITKTQRIEQQLKLLYRTMEEYRDMENKLVATGDRMFHRIYQLEQIARGWDKEDGK